MLPIKSKYKVGKRLGPIFEQLQTQKFALSEARNKKMKRGNRGGNDYGRQLLEKQRVRYTYGLSERQLSNYVEKAMHSTVPAEALHRMLELRADSAIYRAGFAPTRRAARQAISHGHFTVGGRKITTPSYALKKGDSIAVREAAAKSPLYAGLGEKEDKRAVPQWLGVDFNLVKAEVQGEPQYVQTEVGLDYPTVFEFYSR